MIWVLGQDSKTHLVEALLRECHQPVYFATASGKRVVFGQSADWFSQMGSSGALYPALPENVDAADIVAVGVSGPWPVIDTVQAISKLAIMGVLPAGPSGWPTRDFWDEGSAVGDIGYRWNNWMVCVKSVPGFSTWAVIPADMGLNT